MISNNNCRCKEIYVVTHWFNSHPIFMLPPGKSVVSYSLLASQIGKWLGFTQIFHNPGFPR